MDNYNSISLLEKGKKGILGLVFSRLGLIVLLMIVQIGIIIGFFKNFRDYSQYYMVVNTVLSVCVFLNVLNSSHINPTAKITWMFVIAVMPVFGAALYWYSKNDIGFNALKYQRSKIIKSTINQIPQDKKTLDELSDEARDVAMLASYLGKTGCYPVYKNTSVKYFSSGEEKFARMLAELEKAEKFIFLEYFIIDEGVMWGKILNILARKASQGLEVMVMYDGSNEFTTLPRDYCRKLAQLGIKAKVFAPATPFVSTHYNYRDHRKILVIDGKVAFTGGVNLADEYINAFEKYGHWKDAAVMLKGEGVKSFALMFLQMWNIIGQQCEYTGYLDTTAPAEKSNGYVIPFADSPLDDERAGRQVYMDIINRADSYVYIMTPYLILDGEMETALKFAAARGVDVRIILPGIPDKKTPYALAKTHYKGLTAAGVKIYEYTPGFVHSKVFVSDDKKAVVGTINLDWRSLYHHFECAVYMYKTDCIPDIKQDFENTLRICSPVTAQSIKKEKLAVKLIGRVMKILAPLM